LLKSDRVLIVLEIKVSKTFECQARQKRMWAAGDTISINSDGDKADVIAQIGPSGGTRFDLQSSR
jgi:NOL1/NOP2/fmu family ribosome biogenesis protein